MDELLIYLKGRLKEKIVLGYKECDLLVWADKTKKPLNVLGITLAVGIDRTQFNGKYSEILNSIYSKNKNFKHLYKSGNVIARECNIPFLVIGYNNKTCENGDFYLHDSSNKESHTIDGIGLLKLLNEKFKVNFGNSGTNKPVNERTADVFHDWSRANLSRNYAKADLDAVYINNENSSTKFIEVKRSTKKKVGIWAPYHDDAADYEIVLELSKKMKCEFITLHHCERGGIVKDDTKITYMIIKYVDSRKGKEEGWIKYKNETPKLAKDILKE